MTLHLAIVLVLGTLCCTVLCQLLYTYGIFMRRHVRNLEVCIAIGVSAIVELVTLMACYLVSDPAFLKIGGAILINAVTLVNIQFAHILLLVSCKDEHKARTRAWLLYVTPALSIIATAVFWDSPLIVAATNPLAGPIFERIAFGPLSVAPEVLSSLVLVFIFIIALFVFRDTRLSWKVLALIALAALIPGLLSLVEALLAIPLGVNYNYAVFSHTVSVYLICSIYMGYLRTARNKAIHAMKGGYLVFDMRGHLTDLNAFGQAVLPTARIGTWGIQDFVHTVRLRDYARPGDLEGYEFQLLVNGEERHFQVSSFDIGGGVRQNCGNGFLLNETTEFNKRLSDLQIMATVDPLTGARNRRVLPANMHALVMNAMYAKVPVTMLMLDIDWFKGINDTYGHAVGDVVLKQVARLCMDSLRKMDEFYRYGGEEFLVLCVGLKEEAGKQLAERIRHKIETTPIIAGEHHIDLTISLGGVSVIPQVDDGEDPYVVAERYLKLADDCLYRAKERGRNCVEYYV